MRRGEILSDEIPKPEGTEMQFVIVAELDTITPETDFVDASGSGVDTIEEAAKFRTPDAAWEFAHVLRKVLPFVEVKRYRVEQI
jgi:hypothetical protein